MKRRLIGLATALGVASIAAQSCADPTSLGRGFADEAGAPPPPSLSPDASESTNGKDGGPVLACVATDCPAPWATCSADGKPAIKCETDLQRDPNHCGACNNKCLTYDPIHLTTRCLDGACQPECQTQLGDTSGDEHWRNCDGVLDNGCEVDVFHDTNHCGACGNACPAGTPCIAGQCGCPAGLLACEGQCVDPRTDSLNCGRCGNVCSTPRDACSPTQTNTGYGCKAGQCVKKCIANAADCNNDLSQSTCDGDGCEVVGLDTIENCGRCGVKCTNPGEQCVDEGNGYECAVPCKKYGKTDCGGRCVDLLSDVSSCGACGDKCEPPGANQIASCIKGVCTYECAPGFGDCNGNALDGCETNLRQHPGNCGACGNQCDLAAGQPCIEGACLMKECGSEETK